MRIATTAAIAALIATVVVAPASVADGDPSLTITGVLAISADASVGPVAHIIAGNTAVAVEPDAVAGLAPGATVEAELAIPVDTVTELGITDDVAVDSAAGEAIVEDAERPFAVESVMTVPAELAPASGPHYVDVAVNTNANTGHTQPSTAQISQAVADASAYWVANTGGVFPGFQVRTVKRYSSGLSCKSADDFDWAYEAATKVGLPLDHYLDSGVSDHLVMVGECQADKSAGWGTVGESLSSGGVVMLHADAIAFMGGSAFLNGLLIHEFGHNFSLGHANGPDLTNCALANVPAYTELEDCDTSEYADEWSLMGFGMPRSYAPLLDIARRDQLGLTDSASLATQDAETTATYELTALGASGGLKGVKIVAGDRTYYVEYRTATGEPGAFYLDDAGCPGEWEPSPTCTEDDGIVPEGPGVRVLLVQEDGATRVEPVRTQVQDPDFVEFALDQGDWWRSVERDVNVSIDGVDGDTATITVRTGLMEAAFFGVGPHLQTGPVLGQPVGVNPGGQIPGGADFSYRWFRDGVEIAGASGSTYTPVAADAGTSLSVRVEMRADGYSPAQGYSPALDVVPGVPTLLGPAQVGGNLTISETAWPAGFAKSYAWLRDGVVIPGATAATYTPVVADYSHRLAVRITGVDAVVGTASVTSAALVVGRGYPSVDQPVVLGTALVGHTLSVDRGSWPAGSTFTYRWYANGKAISGATKSTYLVPSAVAGKKISVYVTGQSAAYNPVSVMSAQRGVPLTSRAYITGTAKAGTTLTAHHGAWTAGTAFTYKWYANGVAIPGATGATYWVPTARVGSTITVKVTGRKTGYTTLTVTSAKTAKVTR